LIVADDAWPFQAQHVLPKQFSFIALLFNAFITRHRKAPLDTSDNSVTQTKVPACDLGKLIFLRKNGQG
jgi:hypothetical protein